MKMFLIWEKIRKKHDSLWPQGGFEEADGDVQGNHLLFNVTPKGAAAEP